MLHINRHVYYYVLYNHCASIIEKFSKMFICLLTERSVVLIMIVCTATLQFVLLNVTRYEKTRLSAGIIILSYGLIITKNLYLGETHFII